MTTVEIPSFNWMSQYYAQILESLIEFKRTNVPELTNESAEEPLIQQLRAFALVGHLCNVLADVVANECTLRTAKLPETIRDMLALIDYALSPASPAQSDIVFELAQTFAAATTIVSAYSQVSTERTATQASIPYEILAAVATERTDKISSCLAFDAGTEVFTDYTTEANSDPGDDFTVWGTPIQQNDALYIGHKNIEWDKLKAELDTDGDDLLGVWEYYDGDALDAKPNTVKQVGSTLRFGVNSVLGTAKRSGATIRVQFDQTGSFEDVESVWGDPGSEWGEDRNYIETVATLGQGASPSEEVDDYTVGSLWKEVPDLTDGTDDGGGPLSQAGEAGWTLPESVTHNWQKTTIEGIDAYWLRIRIIENIGGSATSPIVDRLRLDVGKQYLKSTAVQGQRQIDSPLGTSDGSASQRFDMTKDHFIWASETVTVDAVAWSRVDNFLQSKPTDRHYQIELGDNDRATIVFGDGTRGAIPANGATIASTYRWGAQEDGNVGANTITRDNSGISYITRLWNPRAATGWVKSQIADEEALELAKILGPASLRIVNVALGPDDVETLALEYTDAAGSKPFVRALAIEELYGAKTIGLVLVAAGAGAASETQLSAIDEYFNGDKYAAPPIDKKLVANQEVTSSNYVPVTINVTADVYGDVTAATVQDFLTALIHPETKQADGVTYEWEFGEDIYLARITHEIFNSDPDIYRVENVKLSKGGDTPAASNVSLDTQELPIAGTITITVYA